MDGFGPRRYREDMGDGRFASFTAAVRETDLWIGLDRETYRRTAEDLLRDTVLDEIITSRSIITEYDMQHPGFLSSLEPLGRDPEAAGIISKMLEAGISAGIGPMGAVAGTVAAAVGVRLLKEFSASEIIVENGGDLFICIQEPLSMRIYAGSSPLSDRLALQIPPELSPLGVCTSAGRVGPSFSLGSADAVMIACEDASMADAYATAYANQVKRITDVQRVIELIRQNEDVISAVVIKDDKAGICGPCEVQVVT